MIVLFFFKANLFNSMDKRKTIHEFTEDDIIAVFGGEQGKDSHIADAISICKVLVVGQNDLIVTEVPIRFFSTHHTVPKSICLKLSLAPSIVTSSTVMVPMVGDLVVSFDTGKASKPSERTSGILYKIIYRLGKAEKYVLLCGTEMVTVGWNDLIVLHRHK